MSASTNTRARKACANCWRKKVRCVNEDDGTPCAKCVEGGLHCVYPPSRTQATGGSQNKTACDACRKDRIRCWFAQGEGADWQCTSCQEKEVECSHTALREEEANDGQTDSNLAEPLAGPSNYPGALTVERPALTVDATVEVDDPGRSSTSVSPITRTSSPRGNWKEVCLAPSPEAEPYKELYEAYAAQ